ncbi:MAG: hypothetical protein H6813_03930 [Phycisphaeraceae bacterium]|nr:hypothetical protein [Phycisphaeraceae bacterium]MCB9847095.1 hypothetical protein [Phycisphaeraceae bacterium]
MLKTLFGNLVISIMALLALASPALGDEPAADSTIQWEFTTKGKVVVIADVFTDYDDFTRLLASHNLIDHNNNWIAEDAHLVQTGNIFPRPSDWRTLNNLEFEHERIARLLMKLDKQAREQGGRVHSLMGILDVVLLRWRADTIPMGTLEVFAGPDAEAKRQVLVDRWAADCLRKNAHYPEYKQKQLKQDHDNYMEAIYPVGCVEFFERFGKYNAQTHSFDLDTDYAKWVRSRNSIVKINGVIYAYSGISPVMAGFEPREGEAEAHALSIGQMNDLVRARNDDPTLFFPADADNDGPIWWSGLTGMSEGEAKAYMRRIEEQYDAVGMVVGRTPNHKTVALGDILFLDSAMGTRDFRRKINTLLVEGHHWTVVEERRPIEEGDFGTLSSASRVLPGGPENPVKPGGGVPRISDTGDNGR